MDILDSDLEAVEAARLRPLDFGSKVLGEVLVDDAVRGREEREDRRDEVALLVVELLLPILHVMAEIDFFGRPERGLSFFVHSPAWEGVVSTA